MGPTEFLLVVAVGGGILAVLFATFKGAAADAESDQRGRRSASKAAASGKRSALEERWSAAIRSLEEIEADYEGGNLSQEDYEGLRRRYQSEANRLESELADLAAGPAAEDIEAAEVEAGAGGKKGSWMGSAIGWAAGAVAFVALAWLVMSQALSPRGEGDTITGSLPGQEAGTGSMAAPIAEVDREQLAQLENRVATNPNDVEALVALGHLYLRLQRYNELTQVTRMALDLDPENPEALTHLGMLLFFTQHPQGVMGVFDQALAIDPDFAEALQFKGMVAFMSQDFATAVEAWDHYLEVVPPEEASPRIRAMLESARASAAQNPAVEEDPGQ